MKQLDDQENKNKDQPHRKWVDDYDFDIKDPHTHLFVAASNWMDLAKKYKADLDTANAELTKVTTESELAKYQQAELPENCAAALKLAIELVEWGEQFSVEDSDFPELLDIKKNTLMVCKIFIALHDYAVKGHAHAEEAERARDLAIATTIEKCATECEGSSMSTSDTAISPQGQCAFIIRKLSLAAIAEELKQKTEDAERYQWLRSNCRVTAEARFGCPEHAALVYYYGLKNPNDRESYTANGLDAAIDAARKA